MEPTATALSPDTTPASHRIEAAAVLAGGVLVLVGALLLLRWLSVAVVDDAAISLRYGLTFFSGHGLRLTPFSPPVEGFSDPLWVFLIGLAGPLHLPPVAFMQGLGIACGLLALVAFGAWGPAAFGRSPRLEDLIAPACAAFNPSYLTWIGSGLESGLLALLLGVAGALFLRALRRKRGWGFGVPLGLLCLTHPDAPLLVLALAALGVAVLIAERRRPDAGVFAAAGVVLLIGGGYLLARWLYFADVLPNTYYAKRGWRFDELHYLGSFVQAHRPLCALLVVSLLAGFGLGTPSRRMAGLSALWLGCAVFFAWLAHGDWMGEWRFLSPYLPLLGVPAAASLSALRARLPFRAGVPVIALAALLSVGAAAAAPLQRSAQVRRSPQFGYAFVAENARRVVALTHGLGERHPRIGMPDLGGLAMAFPDADLVDVAGLADYVTAHHAGNLPAIEDFLIHEGAPSVLDAHGPSGHLNRMPALMSLYRWDASGWRVLRGLSRDADPRCPGGKVAVLSLDAAGLVARMDERLTARDPETALRLWQCARDYEEDDRLPTLAQRAPLIARARKLLAESQARDPRLALRAGSLATVLSGEDAHLRRETERLRSRLFPDPPIPR